MSPRHMGHLQSCADSDMGVRQASHHSVWKSGFNLGSKENAQCNALAILNSAQLAADLTSYHNCYQSSYLAILTYFDRKDCSWKEA